MYNDDKYVPRNWESEQLNDSANVRIRWKFVAGVCRFCWHFFHSFIHTLIHSVYRFGFDYINRNRIIRFVFFAYQDHESFKIGVIRSTFSFSTPLRTFGVAVQFRTLKLQNCCSSCYKIENSCFSLFFMTSVILQFNWCEISKLWQNFGTFGSCFPYSNEEAFLLDFMFALRRIDNMVEVKIEHNKQEWHYKYTQSELEHGRII